jgi:uncharacterized protein YqhQ
MPQSREPSTNKPQFQLGGQALIEGVMMRGPSHVGAAVRRGDGSIETRVEPFTSILKKRPYLNIFMLRGIFALIEMMALGMNYLNWSSNLALEDENVRKAAAGQATTNAQKKLPLWLFLLTILGSLSIGAGLFVVLPNMVAHLIFEPLIGNGSRTSIVALTWIEGFVKICIFVAYVYIIGRRKAIRRVFEFHGAEHKVVYAVENDRPLTPEGARPFDTPHPRCGTGFALLTVFVSILCYSFLPWPDEHLQRVGLRLLLMPLVAGISYEILKATVNPRLKTLAVLVMTPGLWLQRLTTEQPDDAQLEVACEAMRVLLEAETEYKKENS